MGLDMYLDKVYFMYGFQTDDKILTIKGCYPANQHISYDIDMRDIKRIETEVKYWRKANQIHKWFVDNVQNGHDDCGRYYVSKENLEDLLKICKQVVEIYNDPNKSTPQKEKEMQEILPTQAGFFFGGLEYDENYIEDVQDTIDAIEREQESETWKDTQANISYFYQSSW